MAMAMCAGRIAVTTIITTITITIIITIRAMRIIIIMTMSIRSFSLRHDAPIPVSTFEMFLDLLRSTHGEKLLRMKGIVQIAGRPGPPGRHPWCAEDFPSARAPAAMAARQARNAGPDCEGLAGGLCAELFDAFLGRPGLDRPDRAAMTENPLAIPGFSPRR